MPAIVALAYARASDTLQIENVRARMLDSRLAIQPPNHSRSDQLIYAGTHSGWRKRHPAAAPDCLHAETNRSDLQPAVSPLPNRHLAARGRHGHYPFTVLST